jgi:4a-hydroxytetrahydrobiopterin dehydratase
MKLTDIDCIPCRRGEPKLSDAEIDTLLPEVPAWEVVTEGGIPQLRRSYKFKNFARALDFTNMVGALAEEQDHHPAILTEWGRVTLFWWTHVIGGLHQNDFISAAKSDALYAGHTERSK